MSFALHFPGEILRHVRLGGTCALVSSPQTWNSAVVYLRREDVQLHREGGMPALGKRGV
jgi:hypothetical protein